MQSSFKGLFLLLCLLFISKSFGQIAGNVYSENGTPISGARVTIWESESKTNLIAYTFSDNDGHFTIKFQVETSNLIIEVTALNFATNTLKFSTVDNPVKIFLQSKEIILKEIEIINKPSVVLKNDTVFYNPVKFLDGTERKAEDLIDKLPGISVNKISGEIKYKGKVVETVMLGGDDLFGENYAIGTKNISVDMIEEVQAIENYSNNRLLKGIEDSEKVILNLKLKKQKTDYSGTAMINNGYGENFMYNNEATLIGVSSKIKSFGVFSLNNIGSTVKDILDNAEQRISNVFNQSYLARTELDDTPRKLNLPANRANFNRSIFGNYNLIYKLLPKLTIKNNVFVIRDRLDFTENIENEYFINNIYATINRNFIIQQIIIALTTILFMKQMTNRN